MKWLRKWIDRNFPPDLKKQEDEYGLSYYDYISLMY